MEKRQSSKTANARLRMQNCRQLLKGGEAPVCSWSAGQDLECAYTPRKTLQGSGEEWDQGCMATPHFTVCTPQASDLDSSLQCKAENKLLKPHPASAKGSDKEFKRCCQSAIQSRHAWLAPVSLPSWHGRHAPACWSALQDHSGSQRRLQRVKGEADQLGAHQWLSKLGTIVKAEACVRSICRLL